jgi:hypothetical protein
MSLRCFQLAGAYIEMYVTRIKLFGSRKESSEKDKYLFASLFSLLLARSPFIQKIKLDGKVRERDGELKT